MKNYTFILTFLMSMPLFSQTVECITPGGIQDSNPTINNVLTDCMSAVGGIGTISIQGDVHINDDFTIPEGIVLKFYKGAQFVVGSNVTLTINGVIEAGLYHIFDAATTAQVLGATCTIKAYPEWFGAVGDGSANDSQAILHTLNLSSQIEWPAVYYSDTDVIITDPCFDIQKLQLKNTTLIIDATGREFVDNTIRNTAIFFDKVNNAIVPGSKGLYLKRGKQDCTSKIRDLLIDNLSVEHCDYAVFANSNDRTHSLGTVHVTNSMLKYNNYSVYFEENEDGADANGVTYNQCDEQSPLDSSVPIINSINDISITDNVFYSIIKDVYMKSADGVLIANNTFFKGNVGEKTKSIHLGTNLSDQVKIHDNQIFEPQEEGVLLERVKSFQIDNNNIVATRSLKTISSKIRVQTFGRPIQSTITGNVIRKATKHGIEIEDLNEDKVLTQSIFVDANVIYTKARDTILNSNGEEVLLANIDHYGVEFNGKHIYMNGVNHALKEELDADENIIYTEISNFDVQKNIEFRQNFSKYPSGTILNETVVFDGVNEEKLIQFRGGYGSQRYSFMLKIHCWRHKKESIDNDTVNSATYLLLVSESATPGPGEEVAVIGALGLADNGSGNDIYIPDNWPAFNFRMENNTLYIAHKNGKSIEDEFSFEIIKIGNGQILGGY